ncbi:hypothetical protein Dsin_007998 [Dipteronia sinensis]|uniref:DUF1421 domain-containing protein n=1 Tax=Dipteronia sinensis TaxID=43782 RepID=A0AAE0B1Q6_9ROSI|nr:hypothetical protein Dsin_007998 [Dipteronia sinensis]
MDKQVSEHSRSQQQPHQTHNFFDLDDEFERDYGSQSLSFDSFRPKHKSVPFFSTVGDEKVGTFDGADLVSEIDHKIKEQIDNVLYAVEGLSARVTQLETRTCKMENTVDDLKESIEYNHGRTDGKLRELENILREVVGGVKDLKDKQEIAEAQLQLAKLQLSMGNPQFGKQNSAAEADSTRQDQSFIPQQSYQLPPDPVPCLQQPAALASGFPQNLQHQNPLPATVATAPQLPPQLPQKVMPSISSTLTPEASHLQYHMPSTQQSQLSSPVPYQSQQSAPPEITNQQYHMTSTQQSQPPPPALHQSYQQTSLDTTNQQYHMTPTQQSPLPPAQYQPTPRPPISQLSQPPQLHPPSSTVYAQAHSSLSHQPEEVSYFPSQSIQKSSQPPGGFFPPQRFYDGSTQQTNEQPPSRPYSEFPSGYLKPSEDSYSNNLYRYGSSPFSSSTSNMKPLRPSPSPSVSHSGISTSRLPTAKILPEALPTASIVESGSPSGASTNRVPVDEVIDNVAAMGFRRDTVRATVRKLTENGQSVDLNVVLDKLMNNA